jgi:hypothetical protein
MIKEQVTMQLGLIVQTEALQERWRLSIRLGVLCSLDVCSSMLLAPSLRSVCGSDLRPRIFDGSGPSVLLS